MYSDLPTVRDLMNKGANQATIRRTYGESLGGALWALVTIARYEEFNLFGLDLFVKLQSDKFKFDPSRLKRLGMACQCREKYIQYRTGSGALAHRPPKLGSCILVPQNLHRKQINES